MYILESPLEFIKTPPKEYIQCRSLVRFMSIFLLMFTVLASPSKGSDLVTQTQSILTGLGYNVGTIDGIYGKKTEKALKKFYQSKGQEFTPPVSLKDINNLTSALELEASLRVQLNLKNDGKRIFDDIFLKDLTAKPLLNGRVEDEYLLRPTVVAKYNRLDLEQDGTDEILITPAVNTQDDKYHDHKALITPYFLSFNHTTKYFENNSLLSSMMDPMHYPRRVEVFIDRNSGSTNFIIADYGLDGPNPSSSVCNRGGRNKWYKFDNGHLTNLSNLLPDIYDTTHDLRVGYINNDNQIDILVINDPMKGSCQSKRQTFRSYLLLSNSSGDYDLKYLDDSGFKPRHLYLSGYIYTSSTGEVFIIAVNDGIHERGTVVDIYKLQNRGDVKFQLEKSFSIPNNTMGNDIAELKYGNEQDSRIVISNAYDGWRGNQLMFLKFMNGLWYNLKNPLPEYNEQPSSPKDKGWCQKIFIVDFDQNGFDDLVCSSHSPAGKYQEWRPPVIMFYEGEVSYPLLVGRKGKMMRQVSPILIEDEFSLTGYRYAGYKDGVDYERIHGFLHIDDLVQ